MSSPRQTRQAAPPASDAPSDPSEPRVPLGEFLVEAGLIDAAQLRFALRVQEKLHYHRRLGEVIGELELVDREELLAAIRRHRRRLSVPDILLDLGLVRGEDADRLRTQYARFPDRSLESLLIEHNLIDDRALVAALAEKLDLPVVTPRVSDVDPELLQDVSLAELRKLELLPLARLPEGGVRVAVHDPRCEDRMAIVRTLFGERVELALTSRAQIQATLDALEVARRSQPDATNPELSVVKLFEEIIARAYRENASDVHIEPLPNSVRVRFRIDGVLVHRLEFPRSVYGLLIGRIKVLAEVDIAERRRHQDGRLSLEVDGRRIDLRASFYVNIHGESAVLRILGQRQGLLPLDQLGMAPRILSRYAEDVLEPETGIVVLTGPTGSGKTTTLSSSISELNRVDVKIITAEDPVEYQIEGVTQCQVNPNIGLTYDETLRAIVRQDPDVIVLGEIRDHFSAEVAIQASLTGHKVFTTFHTEDAVGGLLRLLHMGIETFLISSTLLAVVAQRLVRRACLECARPYLPTQEEVRRSGLPSRDAHRHELVRGAGCEACGFTGYRGRIGIFEVLVLNDDVRQQLHANPTGALVRDVALVSGGLVTMREDGLAKALAGITTLEEVSRYTPRGGRVRGMDQLEPLLGIGG